MSSDYYTERDVRGLHDICVILLYHIQQHGSDSQFARDLTKAYRDHFWDAQGGGCWVEDANPELKDDPATIGMNLAIRTLNLGIHRERKFNDE